MHPRGPGAHAPQLFGEVGGSRAAWLVAASQRSHPWRAAPGAGLRPRLDAKKFESRSSGDRLDDRLDRPPIEWGVAGFDSVLDSTEPPIEWASRGDRLGARLDRGPGRVEQPVEHQTPSTRSLGTTWSVATTWSDPSYPIKLPPRTQLS
jgi:hypothetical protein